MDPPTDPDGFSRPVARILRWMIGCAGAGAVAAGLLGGIAGAAGFAAGAAVSYLNFRWLKQLVEALGSGGKRPRARLAVWLGLRYVILGIGGYAILKYSAVSLAAALAGLFVPVAAVILEILFELIYARY